MADIKRLDYYLGALSFVKDMLLLPSGFGFGCNTVSGILPGALNGNPVMFTPEGSSNSYPQIGDVNILDTSVQFLQDLNSISSASPEVILNNHFRNDSDLAQQYLTLAFDHTTTSSTTTTVTHGVKTGGSVTTKAGGKVGVPFVAEGEAEVSATISAEYDFSNANATTNSDSKTLHIPSQTITVPPHQIGNIEILLAKISVPQTAVALSGRMNGNVTDVTLDEYSVGDVYDIVKYIESKCPNAAVGGSTGLTLNDSNQSVYFSGSGFFQAELTVYDFFVKTSYSPIDNPTQETNVQFKQGKSIILSSSTSRHSIPISKKIGIDCKCN